MNPNDPTTVLELMESLKSAIARFERLQAERETAERNVAAGAEATSVAQMIQSLAVVTRTLREAAQQKPEVRQALAGLGAFFQTLAGAESGVTTLESDVRREETLGSPAGFEPPPTIVAPAELARPAPPPQNVPLRIGGIETQLQVPGTADEALMARLAAVRSRNEAAGAYAPPPSTFPGGAGAPADLQMVVRRCRLKVEGCRWAASHRERWVPQSEDAAERKVSYDSIIARAKALPNCYVWALNPRVTMPAVTVVKEFAEAYENLAIAADVVDHMSREKLGEESVRPEAYAMLAEAQSAIRAAIEREGLYVDQDQEDAFHWLRRRTFEDRVLVERHMKLEDPADIAGWAGLRQRLELVRARMDSVRSSDSQRKNLLNKAKYHAKRLADETEVDRDTHWSRLMASLDELVALGLPPSDVAIREIMLPLADLIPDDLQATATFDQVLQALDLYVATREQEAATELRFRAPTAEVLEAARLLEGTAAVLIGGECRRQSQQALERELKLSELRWVAAAHHQSHFSFEPAIARADTAVVILAIRWSSHSFENVKALCEKHGKPYVRLPGGYNPNQVAKQILDQVGEQLRIMRSRGDFSGVSRA